MSANFDPTPSLVAIAPTIQDSPDYADTDVVGGIQELAGVRSGAGIAEIESIVLKESGGITPALTLLFFSSLPAGGTYTENSALALSAADKAALVGRVSIATGDWKAIGGAAIANLNNVRQLLRVSSTAGKLWLIIAAAGAYNAGATDALTGLLGFRRG